MIIMEAKDELKQFYDLVIKVKDSIEKLLAYKGNAHYKKQTDTSLVELNRTFKYLKAKMSKIDRTEVKEKFQTVEEAVSKILSDITNKEKIELIKNLERFWPDLEIEFETLKLNIRSFEIPEEIPMTEYRLDLEESIKDFDNGCFISSLVMCRRAYEGALVNLYKSKTGKEPIEEVKCKNCKATIRDKSYMGIAKLHDWAIQNGFVTDKLKQVGFLLTDMGAGAAHPPLTQFPRDKDMAKLGITATIALLKEINSRKETEESFTIITDTKKSMKAE